MSEKSALQARLASLQGVQAWCLKSEAAPRLNAMVDLARSEESMPVMPGDMDRDPWLLNCPNGTIDLTTGELRSHRREDLLTNLCPVSFDAKAVCPIWESSLKTIFARDENLISFNQKFLGYSLTGEVSEQLLPVWCGCGSNGKTLILRKAMETIGTDYASPVPPELLLEQKGEQHPTIVAQLFGKRLCVAFETDEGRRLNEGRIKTLTGTDLLKARRMKEDFWQFPPTHKLILVTNHKPEVRGQDHGIWCRLALVPFTQTFWDADKGETGPEELKADKNLDKKLNAEAPGILRWLVDGCLAWQRDGLTMPSVVKAATAEYRSAQDIIGSFIAEVCVTGNDLYRQKLSDLFAAFEAWIKAAGEKTTVTRRAFAAELRGRGLTDTTSDGLWFHGIKISAEAQPERRNEF